MNTTRPEVLALAKTPRLAQIATRASSNKLVRQLHVRIVLVDGNGAVSEIG
jgi:hypothetical protein